MNINITSKSNNYNIGEHKLNKIINVISYKYEHCKPILNIIQSENINYEINEQLIPQYFIFDCPGNDAFGHWIYECFIFVPMFLELIKIYPEIKILTTNIKKYCKIFFKLWGINNEIINTIENPVNICFFPPVLSLNDNNIDQSLFIKYIDMFVYKINDILEPYIFPSRELLFLPRNNIDNYISNDRIIEKQSLMESNVILLGGTSLNTYQINDILLQFLIIKNSNKIALDFGSSFLVNCIFLKNKQIIIYSGFEIQNQQVNNYISMKILYNIISNNNQIIFSDRLVE
jgi:hypothetical protein